MEIEIKSSKGIMFPIELAKLCGIYEAIVYAVLWDAAKEHNGTISMSYNEISNQTDIPSRSIPRLINKLELSHVLSREYNQGQSPTYHVKNIMLEDDKLIELPDPKLTDQVPAIRSERVQPYYKPTKELVWRSDDGNLAPGYRYYGELNMVAITDAEYSALCDKHTKKVVDKYISRIEIHCKAYGKQNEYSDFAAVIEDWIRKDNERDKRELKRRKNGKSVINVDDEVTRQEIKELDKYKCLVNRLPYGEYENVILGMYEYNDLCVKYGKTKVDAYITEMDRWCEAKNESYPNYKAALEMWIERDIKKHAGNDIIMQQELREISKYLDLVD